MREGVSGHRTLLLVHLGATLFMVGLIWFVQVAHYPLFAMVGGDSFAAYAKLHARLTTWVVALPMLAELATGLLMLHRPPAGVPVWVVGLGAVLLALVWISTWGLQVPQHEVLARGFDVAAHEKLVTSNWLRTLAWSGRGALVLWMVGRTANP